ncbi:pentapeptide repeat-containing protein [Thiotrichales bacterium 19X7-9]|nr:pentapeptide repeat-containing protein [Thiotrichales bacterium 19X7-9]
MKEYIGLKSWLESKFIEQILYKKLHNYAAKRTVVIGSLDDASTVDRVLTHYNETLGEEGVVLDSLSYSGTRRVGIRDGKNWQAYDQLVIPINAGAAHNEALILFPNAIPKKAIFVDPYGSTISSKRRRELEKLNFTEILSVTQEVQKDTYRCGDYTIELVDCILGEDQPDQVDQHRLNAIAGEVRLVDQNTLDNNRAQYVQDYILSLIANGVDPLEREVVISTSLMDRVTGITPNYSSNYLSVESDKSVGRHDSDARLRDSQVYRSYINRDRYTNEVFTELDDDMNLPEFNSEDESDDEELPILDDFDDKELEFEDKVITRQKETERLIIEIKSLEIQIQTLKKISNNSSITTSEISQLEKNDSYLNTLIDNLESLQSKQKAILEEYNNAADVVNKTLNEALLQKVEIDELPNDISKQTTQFLLWQETITETIKRDESGLDKKIEPLFEAANKYQQQYIKLQKVQSKLKSLEGELKSLTELNGDKVDLMMRWELLKTATDNAKEIYKDSLSKNFNKSDKKFLKIENYKKIISDNVSALTYEGIAEALYETHQFMKSQETFSQSRSRGELLKSLDIFGIKREHFKLKPKEDENCTLVSQIKKIDCNSDDLFKHFGLKAKKIKVSVRDKLNESLHPKVESTIESLKVAKESVAKEKLQLSKVTDKHTNSLKQVMTLTANESLGKELIAFKPHSKKLTLINTQNDKAKELITERKDLIKNETKSYLSGRIETLEKSLSDKLASRDEKAQEEFTEEIDRVKTSINQEVEFLSQQLELLNRVKLENQALFLDIKEQLVLYTKQLESLTHSHEQECEKFSQFIQVKPKPGEVFSQLTSVKTALQKTSTKLYEVKRKLSETVFWLSVNASDHINLPLMAAKLSSEGLDFSQFDLRAASLSMIHDENSGDLGFRFANYKHSKIGSISVDELQEKLNLFKKKITKESDSLNDIIEQIDGDKLDLKTCLEAWREHLPFYPVLDSSNSKFLKSSLMEYISKAEKVVNNSLKTPLSTTLPIDMSSSNLRDAQLNGQIMGVRFDSAVMPKSLCDVEFIKCSATKAHFRGTTVNENTKLMATATDLQGLVIDVKKGNSFSLMNMIFDGEEGATLPHDLRGVDLSGVRIRNMDLTGYLIDDSTVLDGVQFENVRFSDCQMKKAVFDSCVFNNCRFQGSDELDLKNTTFNGCIFNNTQFSQSIRSGGFNECSFINIQFGFISEQFELNFNDCQFLRDTFVGMDCSLAKSRFVNTNFDIIKVKEDSKLPKVGSNIEVNRIRMDDGYSFDESSDDKLEGVIKQSIFSNSRETTIKFMTAKQFLDQLSQYIDSFKSDSSSKPKSWDKKNREKVHTWIEERVGYIDGLSEYYTVLETLEDWKQGKVVSEDSDKSTRKSILQSNASDFKWRVFNHHSSWKSTNDSSKGIAIINLFTDRIGEINLDLERESYLKKRITPDLKCFQKAFDKLVTYSEVDNLNLTSVRAPKHIDLIKLIRDAKWGVADFGIEEVKKASQTSRMLREENTSSITTKQQRRLVADVKSTLKPIDKYNAAIDLTVHLLTQEKTDKIDQVIDSFTPSELLRFLQAVETKHAYKYNQSNFKTMNESISTVSIALQAILFNAVEATLNDLKNKDEQRYFLNLMASTPFTGVEIISQKNVEEYFRSGTFEFSWGSMPADLRMGYINELLDVFNKKYTLYKAEERKTHHKVRDLFIGHFEMKNSNDSRNVVDFVSEKGLKSSISDESQRTDKARELINQIEIKKEPIKVNWPSDLSSKFEGKATYDLLKDSLKEFFREKALDKQVDKFVRKVIIKGAKNYYNSVNANKSKVNRRLKGIANILTDGNIKITLPDAGEKLLTMDDLNAVMKKLHSTRGVTKRVNQSEKEFKRVIEEHASDQEIFKPISGNELPTVKVNGELTDKTPVTVSLDTIGSVYNLGVDDGIKSKGLPNSVNGKLKILKHHVDSLKREIQKLDKCKTELEQANSKTSVPESSGVVSDLEHDFKVSLMALGSDGIVHGKSSGDGMLKTSKKIKEVQKRTVKSISSLKTRIKSNIESLVETLPSTHFDSTEKAKIENFAKDINESSTYIEIESVYKKITQALNKEFDSPRTEPILLFQSHDRRASSDNCVRDYPISQLVTQ